MKVGYYPGCSLESSSPEYNSSVKDICGRLGIELNELEDWNCCGATSAHCIDEEAAFLLSARVLEIAEKDGLDLAVPCSGCFSRLKFAEKNARDPRFKGMTSFSGSIKIIDMLSLVSTEDIIEKIQNFTVKPLTNLKVAPYYGCMSMRPPKVTGVKDWENPDIMERIIKAVGAETIEWSFRTICCGGGLSLSRTDIARKMMLRILDMAEEAGADCLVTSCPMCQTNLDTRMKEISKEFSRDFYIPVLFFSELIGLALGSRDVKKWFRRHLVNPTKVLKERGLL